MNIRFKLIKLVVLIIVMVGLNAFLINDASASFTAGPATGRIDVVCAEKCGNDSGKLQLVGYKGSVEISVYSRPFNFALSSGGNLSYNGNVSIGSTLTFSPFGSASGSWTITGGGNDTPDMNNTRYAVSGAQVQQDPKAGVAGIAVWSPSTTDPISITGGGSVSCNGWTCTANNVGSAYITVKFASGSVQAKSMPRYPNQSTQCGRGKYDCGEDTENISYGEQSTTIYFNVYQPNKSHTVKYNDTTNIDYNTATANWIYSDPEGDIQINSHIQIATDPNFNNIIFNRTQENSSTSFSINNLNPGTTYYPRVKANNNPNGWSEWSTGQAFTTLNNNLPNLEQLSCNGEGTGYTTGILNWSYTGIDEPGDELILKARWKKENTDIWTVEDLLYNNREGRKDIANLVSGFDYEIQVSLNDNRNAYLGDRWKGCGTLTALEYPNPEVKFELSKTQDSNAKVTENGFLTVRSGESIKLDWAVTNVDGVDSCNISTDSDNIFSSNSYSGILSKLAPSNLDTDKNYIVRLFCEGKEAKNRLTVDKKINLKVEAYPTISCQIDGGRKSVKEGDNEVKVIARVGNVRDYIWKSGIDNNDKTKNVQSSTRNNNSNPFVVDEFNINLNYGGTGFGQYQPWVEITKRGTNRIVSTTCGTITNFGDSSIKEINP